MASKVTRQRIIRESCQIKFMNIVQLILTQMTGISVAFKLVTDSTNFFAPSAELEKINPGNDRLFCVTSTN